MYEIENNMNGHQLKEFQNALVQIISCLGTDLGFHKGFKLEEIYSTVKSNTNPALFSPLLIHVRGMESSD